ncbi:MAG: SufC of the ABC transporter [Candidatus Roizmanbacteria bacterium GW2011_GWC2_37_13]|uniref:SufC of the ABC transporter n=1 Tax=Candidatus Roizmanbacteria bacterium GW2011_GWC2_37_13 TaxID=1618486 RepID=A0A0G0JEF2_9BACT|nr:MAG: SufC of the ABC transporter [Candidatus Roizmanbacteria bacterium GW2011_GWC1_37_12]KKQ26551.1 MAG: SufC of the ABC transporter [Candidatus Roizmanbacteria bacterium GW2011_GWC2_37_13]
MLVLKNLTVSASNKVILKNLNFEFKKNKVYAIMGPNGSGKSTLAYAISGHPAYRLDKDAKIIFNKNDISALPPDKRAKQGVFLSFQTPLSLSGVTVFQLLRLALSGIKDPLIVKQEIDRLAKKLHIKEELLSRSLNDNASGGEKKKLELIQAVLLDPKFLIFDEIDTGVDIDALKAIAKFLDGFKKERTIVLITHYNRILKYIKPDRVLVMLGGRIVKEGDYRLAEFIEKNGYEKYRS